MGEPCLFNWPALSSHNSFLLGCIPIKSFSISGVILIGSFLSLIGVIVGHWVADKVTEQTFFLTATSLIGFIALMGISSRNSLLPARVSGV